jgi:hypothetical protein
MNTDLKNTMALMERLELNGSPKSNSIDLLGDCEPNDSEPKWFSFMEDPGPMVFGYYFWDETETAACGPFRTQDEANSALEEYAKTL